MNRDVRDTHRMVDGFHAGGLGLAGVIHAAGPQGALGLVVAVLIHVLGALVLVGTGAWENRLTVVPFVAVACGVVAMTVFLRKFPRGAFGPRSRAALAAMAFVTPVLAAEAFTGHVSGMVGRIVGTHPYEALAAATGIGIGEKGRGFVGQAAANARDKANCEGLKAAGKFTDGDMWSLFKVRYCRGSVAISPQEVRQACVAYDKAGHDPYVSGDVELCPEQMERHVRRCGSWKAEGRLWDGSVDTLAKVRRYRAQVTAADVARSCQDFDRQRHDARFEDPDLCPTHLDRMRRRAGVRRT